MGMVRQRRDGESFWRLPAGHVKCKFDPTALHYSEITIKSSFHHTPHFMREALDAISRGEIRASDFVTRRIPLAICRGCSSR